MSQLLEEGAEIIAGAENISKGTKLYSIGTAKALAEVFSQEIKESI